jgi:hypothetical protein
MINGMHAIVYAKDAEKTRAFFRDVLKFPSVNVGHGWLIFALPPAELGIHPTENEVSHELYLMCDDMQSTLANLKRKAVEYTAPRDVGWGVLTTIAVPGAGNIGLYQPKHPTALALNARGQRVSSPKAKKSRRILNSKWKPIPKKRKPPKRK